MIIAISILHYVICIFLIVVILLQAGKGHGLAGSGFGGESTQSIFGTQTTSFMTKVTSFTAIGFIITSLTLGILNSAKSKSLLIDSSRIKELPTIPQDLLDKVKVTTEDIGENKKIVTTTVSEKVDTAVAKAESVVSEIPQAE